MQASSKFQERKASMQKDIALVKGMKLTCAIEIIMKGNLKHGIKMERRKV